MDRHEVARQLRALARRPYAMVCEGANKQLLLDAAHYCDHALRMPAREWVVVPPPREAELTMTVEQRYRLLTFFNEVIR